MKRIVADVSSLPGWLHRGGALSTLCATLILFLNARAPAAQPLAASGLQTIVRPFFEQHCVKCHGEKKQKGELRVDNLAIDFDSPKAMANWMEIMSRMNSGEMPPEKQPRPDANDVAR
ncbi:MAG TPA: c-type cytochrome domain-containing protein, partial [Tepidisphaeraceae bacterium]|nr:c-type cytochrome domain-containing protein [Tepidisphaeraceae bacterium]